MSSRAGEWTDIVALIASELSTPIDVVESFPARKATRYLAAAVRLLKAKSGAT